MSKRNKGKVDMSGDDIFWIVGVIMFGIVIMFTFSSIGSCDIETARERTKQLEIKLKLETHNHTFDIGEEEYAEEK